MWNSLVVPSLFEIIFERFSIRFTTSWGPSITPFLLRWKQTIRQTTFCNASLSHDELLYPLHEIPLLEKFEIVEEQHSNYVTNELMRYLEVKDGSLCLAPRLRYIGFKGFYFLFDDEVFVNMVKFRWYIKDERVSRLRAVMLSPERTMDRHVLRDFMDLRKEGLGVYIFGC